MTPAEKHQLLLLMGKDPKKDLLVETPDGKHRIIPNTYKDEDATGAFIKSAAWEAAPAAASTLAGGATFTGLEGALSPALTPVGAAPVAVLGGLGVGLGTGLALHHAKQPVLKYINPDFAAQVEESEYRRFHDHPFASRLGSIAAGLGTMKVTPRSVMQLRELPAAWKATKEAANLSRHVPGGQALGKEAGKKVGMLGNMVGGSVAQYPNLTNTWQDPNLTFGEKAILTGASGLMGLGSEPNRLGRWAMRVPSEQVQQQRINEANAAAKKAEILRQQDEIATRQRDLDAEDAQLAALLNQSEMLQGQTSIRPLQSEADVTKQIMESEYGPDPVSPDKPGGQMEVPFDEGLTRTDLNLKDASRPVGVNKLATPEGATAEINARKTQIEARRKQIADEKQELAQHAELLSNVERATGTRLSSLEGEVGGPIPATPEQQGGILDLFRRRLGDRASGQPRVLRDPNSGVEVKMPGEDPSKTQFSLKRNAPPTMAEVQRGNRRYLRERGLTPIDDPNLQATPEAAAEYAARHPGTDPSTLRPAGAYSASDRAKVRLNPLVEEAGTARHETEHAMEEAFASGNNPRAQKYAENVRRVGEEPVAEAVEALDPNENRISRWLAENYAGGKYMLGMGRNDPRVLGRISDANQRVYRELGQDLRLSEMSPWARAQESQGQGTQPSLISPARAATLPPDVELSPEFELPDVNDPSGRPLKWREIVEPWKNLNRGILDASPTLPSGAPRPDRTVPLELLLGQDSNFLKAYPELRQIDADLKYNPTASETEGGLGFQLKPPVSSPKAEPFVAMDLGRSSEGRLDTLGHEVGGHLANFRDNRLSGGRQEDFTHIAVQQSGPVAQAAYIKNMMGMQLSPQELQALRKADEIAFKMYQATHGEMAAEVTGRRAAASPEYRRDVPATKTWDDLREIYSTEGTGFLPNNPNQFAIPGVSRPPAQDTIRDLLAQNFPQVNPQSIRFSLKAGQPDSNAPQSSRAEWGTSEYTGNLRERQGLLNKQMAELMSNISDPATQEYNRVMDDLRNYPPSKKRLDEARRQLWNNPVTQPYMDQLAQERGLSRDINANEEARALNEVSKRINAIQDPKERLAELQRWQDELSAKQSEEVFGDENPEGDVNDFLKDAENPPMPTPEEQQQLREASEQLRYDDNLLMMLNRSQDRVEQGKNVLGPREPKLHYSLKPGKEKSNDLELGRFWEDVGKDPAQFKYGKGTTSRDVNDIAAEYSMYGRPIDVTEEHKDPSGKTIYFRLQSDLGDLQVDVNPTTQEVTVFSPDAESNTEPAGGGGQMYQIIYDWAKNNGYYYTPSAPSYVNKARIPANAGSSMAKHGTSEHLNLPGVVPNWQDQDPSGLSFPWQENLGATMRQELNLANTRTEGRGTFLENLRLDKTGAFIDTQGNRYTEQQINDEINRIDPLRKSGLGPATLKRVIASRMVLEGREPSSRQIEGMKPSMYSLKAPTFTMHDAAINTRPLSEQPLFRQAYKDFYAHQGRIRGIGGEANHGLSQFDSQTLESVARKLHLAQTEGVTPTWTPEERAAEKFFRTGMEKIWDENVTAGRPMKGKDPYYLPEHWSQDSLNEMVKSDTGMMPIRDRFIRYNQRLNPSTPIDTITEHFDKMLNAIRSGQGVGEEFNPLHKAARQFHIPPEDMTFDLMNVNDRYFARAANDIATERAIVPHEPVRYAHAINRPGRPENPRGVEEGLQGMSDVFSGAANMPRKGFRDSNDMLRGAHSLASAMAVQGTSGIRNILQMPTQLGRNVGNIDDAIDLVQAVTGISHMGVRGGTTSAGANYERGKQEAIRSGAWTPARSTSQFVHDEPFQTRVGRTLDAMGNTIRELGPAKYLEEVSRVVQYLGGEEMAARYWKNPTEPGYKDFMDKYGFGLDPTQSDAENISRMAANFVRSNQTSYGPEDLPQWMVTPNTAGILMRLNRFSMGQYNRVAQDVINPALEGKNYFPLIATALGTLMSGTAVQQFNDFVRGYEEKNPKLKEISEANISDSKKMAEYTLKALDIIQKSGSLGVAGDLSGKIAKNIGGMPTGLAESPIADMGQTAALEVAKQLDSIKEGGDPLMAILDGIDNAILKQVQDINTFRNLTKPKAEKTERQDVRNKAVFSRLHGLDKPTITEMTRGAIGVPPLSSEQLTRDAEAFASKEGEAKGEWNKLMGEDRAPAEVMEALVRARSYPGLYADTKENRPKNMLLLDWINRTQSKNEGQTNTPGQQLVERALSRRSNLGENLQQVMTPQIRDVLRLRERQRAEELKQLYAPLQNR